MHPPSAPQPRVALERLRAEEHCGRDEGLGRCDMNVKAEVVGKQEDGRIDLRVRLPCPMEKKTLFISHFVVPDVDPERKRPVSRERSNFTDARNDQLLRLERWRLSDSFELKEKKVRVDVLFRPEAPDAEIKIVALSAPVA